MGAECSGPCLQVPRLHVITVRKLSPVPGHAAPAVSELRAQAPALRQQVLRVLTAALGGDALAAEYTLLQLLSSVHKRVGTEAVGRHTLNLSGCPPFECHESRQLAQQANAGNIAQIEEQLARLEARPSPFGAALASVLAELAPRVRALGLGNRALNYCSWAPRKDHSTNRMLPSVLQLAEGTQLLLDETALAAGQLGQSGVINMHVMSKLAGSATLDYDFSFYQTGFEVDTPVTILSNARTIFNRACDTHVKLAPTGPMVDAHTVQSALSGCDLGMVRSYLAAAREHRQPPPSAEMTEQITRDWNEARKAHPELTASDLNRW